jgi:hypothetical protein
VALRAQSALGSLRGVVKDAQGVIPGATVQLLNEANGTTRETVTNGVGEYSFPGVQPGTYTLTASMTSYSKYERKGLRIGTQDNLAVDVALEVGGIQETVAVTAQAPLLETTNASTGATLDNKELESIPSAGRSVFLMANLQPTVQTTGNAHWNRMQDQIGNSTVSMGGGPVQANNFLIDGFPVTDLQNRASTNPSLEAIEDMKVQVHLRRGNRPHGRRRDEHVRQVGREPVPRRRVRRLPSYVDGRRAPDSETHGHSEQPGGLA